MSPQRILIVTMIIIQAASIHLMSKTKFFPLSVIAIALSSLVIQYRFTIDRKTKQRLFILLVLFFMMKHVVYRPDFLGSRIFVGTPGSLTIAQFLMTLQLCFLFMKTDRLTLPIRYVGLGFSLLVFTANYKVEPQERIQNQWIVAAFIIAAACYLQSNRNWLNLQNKKPGKIKRQVHLLILLVFIISSSAGTGWMLHRYENVLNSFLGQYLNASASRVGGGKLKKTVLGSVGDHKTTNEESISLRVYSDDEPGYLRGQVFDKFSGNEWSRTTDQKILPPSSTDRDTREHIYDLSSFPELTFLKYEIWPAAGHNEIVYSTIGTSRVKTCLNEISRDGFGSLWTRQPMEAEPYTVMLSKGMVKQKNKDKLHNKLVDSGNIDPRINRLAKKIFKGCQTVKEKISAVEHYFHDNYEYKMGINIPSGEHPLVHFLEKKPAAHCEYFASATVILLRTVNVPCKYATGYVVSEQNNLGGYWVARNKNAHAWAEAYDPEEGWVVVESTPAEGVPAVSEKQAASQIYDLVMSWIHQFRINLRMHGLQWIFWKVISVFQYTFIWMLTGLILFCLIIQYLKKFRKTETGRKLSPLEIQLNRLLKKMDRRLARVDLCRDPSESFQQFINRIDQNLANQPEKTTVIQWYQQYLKARFSSARNESLIVQLKTSMPVIKIKPV